MYKNNKEYRHYATVLFITVAVSLIFLFCRTLTAGIISINVEQGDGAIAIGEKLKSAGAIRSAALFRCAAAVCGIDDEWHEGKYNLNKNSKMRDIIKKLSNSHYGEVKVCINEGMQVKQIAEILAKNGVCNRRTFINACAGKDFNFEFLKGIDKTKRINPLEGYLFPDTYYFYKNEPAYSVISKMLKNFDKKVYTKEIRESAKKQGLTFDEAIRLASIVESEAATRNDRRLVAGVFLRRLKSRTRWKLQSCVTVEYAKGIKKEVISLKDTQYNSPYNTYMHEGLPPGAICCPGLCSIKAVLNPKNSKFKYFQSDHDGKLYFAVDYNGHIKLSERLRGRKNH